MSARRMPGVIVPVALLVLALTLVCGRFLVAAHGSVRAAEAASAAGDRAEAIRCYLDALRAYVPGSPFERQALDGLESLAAAAARTGDREGERSAAQAIRAGLLGTRSTFVPYRGRLAEAEQRLVLLDGARPFPAVAPASDLVIDRDGTPFLRRLAPRGPAVLATLVSLFGFAIWVGAVVALIHRGLAGGNPQATSMSPRPLTLSRAALSGVMLPVLFVLGFGLFLLGLRLT